jgi:cysteine-rich repeat protein
LSTHGAAFNGLSSSKRCVSKAAFSESAGSLGDYKLDHNGNHAGTTRCVHDVTGLGVSHWVRRAICGDGILGADESCDDGNTTGGDGCSASCATEYASCQAILDGEGASSDASYWIDPDGPGGIAPFAVHCDMTIVGGGWTRFNWLHQSYPGGEDPLGQSLQSCSVSGSICRGRIPSNVNPIGLLVKDTTSNEYATWTFDGGTISNAVLAALRDKTQSCIQHNTPFDPDFSTSSESYCGNGGEDGCDSFYYTSGSCMGAGDWGIHWDGDGHWCAAAFKMGATVSGGCGNGDHGFLDYCDCNDEHGEIYYR